MTAADLVIQELADSERDLREANRQLVDLVADLACENAALHIARDATIASLQSQLRERLAQLERLP